MCVCVYIFINSPDQRLPAFFQHGQKTDTGMFLNVQVPHASSKPVSVCVCMCACANEEKTGRDDWMTGS